MADDSTSDALTTGALLVGGGLAGYLAGRWLGERRTGASATTASSSGAAKVTPPAPTLPPSTISAPTSSTPQPMRTPRPPAGPKPVSSPAEVTTPPSSLAHDDSSPVTSPDHVPSTAPNAPRVALPRTYDPIFDRHRGDTPIEYLRALTYSESRMKPRVRSRTGARGLMQITASVRVSFNVAHSTNYQLQDLDDPETNIRIGCWVLRFIATSYAKHHPAVPNMRTDWRNPSFVELLTFGWNAGFSERSGVGKVVSHLEEKGATEIDVELVHGNARAAGAAAHLTDPRKLSWCKGVVALYLRERSLTEPIATPVA